MSHRSTDTSRSGGYIMLDTLIVMTVTMAVLSMSSVWVYRTLRYASEVDHRQQHVRSISRVGHQLRKDAITATSIAADDAVLSLKNDQQNIRYQIKGHQLLRESTPAGQGNVVEHRDRFVFAPNAMLRWQTLREDAVMLNVRRDFRELRPGKKQAKGDQTNEAELDVRLDSRILISMTTERSPEESP